VKFVASTVAEIESLAPWLLECVQDGKEVSILYGIPLSPSAIPRLAAVARMLGPGIVGIFVDHAEHVTLLDRVSEETWPGRIPVWVNIDVGYHREGVTADSEQLVQIAHAVKGSGKAALGGVYTHYGHSYAVSSPEEALKAMSEELVGLEEGAVAFVKAAEIDQSTSANVVLSLGATPTTTSIQNLVEETEASKQYRDTIVRISQRFAVEFHAGVYPVMDMQQLATRARPQQTTLGQSLLSFDDLALRIMVEVASVYPDRTKQPEALVAAGSIVLGREPCKSYPGWGVVTPWPAKSGQVYDPEASKNGWIVGRISQEHGNLTWEGAQEDFRPLHIGQKIMIWPNHACIAGVNHGWFLVVDSDKPDADRIEDIWIRWRGW
jgi:D-serine deaminase-like pyridoxal phosphate-dependent protein